MSDSYGTLEDKYCVDCGYYWFDSNEMTGMCDIRIESTGKFNTCDSFVPDKIIVFKKITHEDS